MNVANLETLCEYRLLEQGIHNYVIRGTSREHADAFIAYMDQLYTAQTGSGPTLCLLTECVEGILPLTYTMGELKKLINKFPKAPRTRTAIIVRDSPMASMMETLIRLLKIRNTRVRYFRPQQREAAIEWLLQED